MLYKNTGSILLATVLGSNFASQTCSAEIITHWYFGLNYLNTDNALNRQSETSSFFEGSVTTNTALEKTGGNGWKLLAGYQLSRYFAVEGAYVDLGRYKLSGTRDITGLNMTNITTGESTTVDIPGTLSSTLRPRGLEVAGVAISPSFRGFTLRARAGLLVSDYMAEHQFISQIPEVNFNSSPIPAQVSLSRQEVKSNEVELSGGLELNYRVHKDWSLGLRWNQYFDVGNEDTGEADISTWGLHFSYHY